MIIAKSILLRSPALQRAMCAMGFHWWREKWRYFPKLFGVGGWVSVHWSRHPLARCNEAISSKDLKYRCRFCGKEE